MVPFVLLVHGPVRYGARTAVYAPRVELTWLTFRRISPTQGLGVSARAGRNSSVMLAGQFARIQVVVRLGEKL